jgi:phosphatidylinositol 3-kinase
MSSSNKFVQELIKLIIKWLKKILPPQYFQMPPQRASMKFSQYHVFFISVGFGFGFLLTNFCMISTLLQFCLQENLVEKKHHRLARSARSGLSDRDAKPTAQIRDQLHSLVYRSPTFQLNGEEQDLIWKYRFYLSTQKKALTKFLKCINWETTETTEVRQALNLLELWTPMDVEDALELLSPNFQYPAVRRYAITRLKQAQDDDLLLYLLQLVQALKYEKFDDIFEWRRRIMNEKDILKSIDDNNSTINDQSSISDSMGKSQQRALTV